MRWIYAALPLLLTGCLGNARSQPLPSRGDGVQRLEIECGQKHVCETEAHRLCPSGYREDSSMEHADAGLLGVNKPSKIEGPDSTVPGKVTPSAPVARTRMVIVCY